MDTDRDRDPEVITESYELRLKPREYILMWIVSIMVSIIFVIHIFFLLQRPEPINLVQNFVPERPFLEDVCDRYRLEPKLVKSLIMSESAGDPSAQSHCDARGLMQIMEPTWYEVCGKLGKSWSFNGAYDPKKNVEVGCFYLRYLIDWATARGYHDPVRVSIQAYNCGMGNVSRGSIPESTRRFADTILNGSSSLREIDWTNLAPK